MKLNTRLISYLVVSFLAVIALQVCLLVFFLNNMQQANELRAQATKNEEAVHLIELSLLKQSFALKNLFIRGHDPSAYYLYLESFFQHERQVYLSLSKIKQAAEKSPELKTNYDKLLGSIHSSSKDYRAAIEAYSDTNTNAHLVADRYTTIEDLILADLKVFSDQINEYSQREITLLNTDIRNGIIVLLLSSIIGGSLLLGSLIWYFRIRFLIPLESAIDTASAIAQGKKDLRMVVSDDHSKRQDFDVFAIAFNEMLDSLEKKNLELKQAMMQLSTAEKLSSLGSLVAGVSHELNTPIGVALTGSSCLGDRAGEIQKAMEEGSITKQQLTIFLDEIQLGSTLIVDNIRIASELIHSFKQVAVDQSSERKRKFNLKITLEEVLATLSPTLKKTQHKIHLEVEPDIEIDSYPGPLGQVITNLINNSLIHGFDGLQQGNIYIWAKAQNHCIYLNYQDDGKGIPLDLQNRVFEPFFTTRMGQGGSGLGMHIVHNIVTGILRGKLHLTSDANQGIDINIEFPMSVDPITDIKAIA
ncbi:sensor histidine kinase [Litoribrevibacter albus]|uniref:histidine kinase n=1 Tax=Litoribrevibacter albus TaxID=1473156 RepID=A0AA37SA52_9GAMM|nr:HAMP domain-containing sensor histidine kinase [Litoribrevibacter albus]GLQ32010.1 hypothetical protein GCM10007876_24890 [Litoribrevibacter albus]